MADIAIAPVKERPLPEESVPKMIPNGIAPMTRGIVARIPAKNSENAELGAVIEEFVTV
jgi:hypothetical protein